jgi:hypothetical protein
MQVDEKGQKRPAKAMTSCEFVDAIAEICEKVNAPTSPLRAATLCYDNPYAHVGKKAQKSMLEKGIDPYDRFKIPPLSGSDFNKIVEHAHGRLKDYMYKWFALQPNGVCVEKAVAVCKAAFYDNLNERSMIKKDVMSLKRTYASIIEAKGGYVTKYDR